ncbi:hypothetical protein [Mesorhizobium sp. M0768]|uniref:hypothetical protein n=1 Tax=unclassified Mesorhizobium TaxID=325217 RepID=UPI003337ECA1
MHRWIACRFSAGLPLNATCPFWKSVFDVVHPEIKVADIKAVAKTNVFIASPKPTRLRPVKATKNAGQLHWIEN